MMNDAHAGQPSTGAQDFDAVLMLTWSDWRTEPRSNRYHYASRFGRMVPVLFLQPELPPGAAIRVEPTDVPGVEIVSVPKPLEAAQVGQLLELLEGRGIRLPLLWIYNCVDYPPLLRLLPRSLRVYHASEDYFTPSRNWDDQTVVGAKARALLADVDLLVGVSAQVCRAYAELGGYRGAVHLAPNGCDAPFFEEVVAGMDKPPREKVCVFQGGINVRLDYKLLEGLATRLPDWTFQFCGSDAGAPAAWRKVLEQPNVEFLGPMRPEDFARRMCEATVGIIPFVQDEMIWNSLPLKAYEYVACGLPVVSVPIHALEGEPRLFALETSVDGFARAIVAAAATRSDPALLAHRARQARANSYDDRFQEVLQAIARLARQRSAQRKRLNVCVLYDQGSNRVNTIREHLEAFGKYSRHQVFYMPGTDVWLPGFGVQPVGAPVPGASEPDFSLFDAVVVHYSVRVNVDGHMTAPVERALARFRGLKAVFVQDEYETPEAARRWMKRVGVDIVYTCVPPADVHKLYPRERFPWIDFRQTLTGYVPEDEALDAFALPLAQRPLLIAYRGRKLPAIYGELGWEKFVIGREVRRLADERGLPVDVEVDDTKRIYGSDWYRFLGSARATLGTESGSNLFDFEGRAAALIKERQARDPAADYGSMREELSVYERDICMNQISPKIFEAIRTRTALVLFEGSYSGVVRAHEHYIPLKKDFSNFDEVVRQLLDTAALQDLTDRAYRDIVESGRYSYGTFVAGIDADLEQALQRGARVRLFAFPLLALPADGAVEYVPLPQAAAALLSTGIVDSEPVREVFVQHAERTTMPVATTASASRHQWVRRLWRTLPAPVRARLGRVVRGLAQWHHSEHKPVGLRFVSMLWRLVPGPAKRAARRLIYGR